MTNRRRFPPGGRPAMTATTLTADGVLAAVSDLLPTLRERAQETEDLRRIPDENIKGLQDTGFFRLLQPRRYDGLEASPVDFYRGVRMIASACGSARRGVAPAGGASPDA